jgi:acetolactate synthase-1/2/3 large subunit
LNVDAAAPAKFSEVLVGSLAALGVKHAFGVSGGGIAPLWAALSASAIAVGHFRHESGAAFAAIEAHFVSGAPVIVFTTTGPGLTNALTGLLAARGEGAKIILLSACTSAAQRGKWAIQATESDTMPGGLNTPGALFHMANTVESTAALPQILRKLANGIRRPGGFVCHLALPTGLQSATASALPRLPPPMPPDQPTDRSVAECAALLAEGNAAIWLGFGARAAAGPIRVLAERLGAAVMCSPRAKGIFPEDHPLFVGVTGMGGHASVLSYMDQHRPRRILVLGTRLGEPTSFWAPEMIPERGFIHVDIDPEVPGVAFPTAITVPVRADAGAFVTALLADLQERDAAIPLGLPRPAVPEVAHRGTPQGGGLVRPQALMAAVQRVVIDRHDALVLAECGNAFTWATHFLRFRTPGRYRVSTGVGAMGHCAAGVVGAALAGRCKAVAIVGDGAMLMNNEVNTAVALRAPALWIVLNDARYNMCEQGMAVLGLRAESSIPQVDFAALARAMGAAGRVAAGEQDLDAALEEAMEVEGPFVLDVRIEPACLAPSIGRNRGLRAQLAGPEIRFPVGPAMAAPMEQLDGN